MERTIKVTGKGKISVKPDTIRLLITQSSLEKTYEGAVKASAEQKENLTTSLEKLGFQKENLKTLRFNVETEYQSYQAKDKSWQRRLTGYRFDHHMKLEFSVESGLLGKVLMKLARSAGKPEFSIEYTISDPEAAKNELLAKAVADSKAKAAVLTTAAGVQLDDILSIDYSWGEIDFVERPLPNMMLNEECREIGAAPDDLHLDIEADDINVTDTVTVIWRIH